jgi:O-antigen/teichoic acid export membrane protein
VNTSNKSSDSTKILGNILSLGIGEFLARLVAYIGIVYLARELGPAGFGIIGFATALYGYFSLPVYAGFADLGSREIARRPKEAQAIAISATLVRLILALVEVAALGTVAFLLNKPALVKLVAFLMGLCFFSLALDTSWVYKGLERNFRPGLALVVGQIVFVTILFFAVKGPGDVYLVPVAQFSGEMCAAILLAISILPLSVIKLDLREGWHILRSSGYLILSQLLRLIMFTFNIVLIGLLIGEREVGLYTAPYRLCFLLLNVAAAIRISYLPGLTRASTGGLARINEVAGRSVELSSAVSAPIVVGGIFAAAPLLKTLFGAEYVEGAQAFRLLLLSIGLIFISDVFQNILLVCDRLKVYLGAVGVAAAANVLFNLILIPRLGLAGAAAATVLAEGILLTLGLIAVYRIGARLPLAALWRPLLACAVMGVSLAVLGSNRALALYLTVGFFTYFLSLLLFRGIPQDARPHLLNLASSVREIFKKLVKG